MPGHCAVMTRLKDLDEVYEHLNEFCADCVEAQLQEAANGEELIFTKGPPSWIAAQEAKKAEIRAEKERQAELERKREAIARKKEREGGGGAVKINWASAEEVKKEEIRKLVAGGVSDKQLEYEIRRIMHMEGAEAAQMRLDLKREAAMKKREAEKEKVKVETKEQIKIQKQQPTDAPRELNKYQKRPWQPTLKTAPGIALEQRSALNVEEQKRYVAILANFHKAEGTTRFEQNRTDLKYYDDRLAPERAIMDGIVREQLRTTTVSMKEMQTEVDFVLTRWASRYINDNRRFERLKKITWGGETEQPSAPGVLKPTLERMLMTAPHPSLTLPATMHDKVTLHFDKYAYDPRNKKMSTPIHEDMTLLSLLADNAVTFAMEATTAVHLMTRPAEPRNYNYNIPVKIFDQFRGGMVVRMCTLGKPRPQTSVTNQTLLHMVSKYRAKSTFIAKAEESKHSIRAPIKSEPEEDTVTESSEPSLIDNILGSLNATLAPSSSGKGGSVVGGPSKASPTPHSYGLFRIPSYAGQDTKLIVRSKPCPRNPLTGGTECILDVKVELACDAGATRQTFEEMLWTSARTIFKGAINSSTVHVHPFSSELLQMTHSRAVACATQHNEGYHAFVSTRTAHLGRLLGELQHLETGEYLLQVSQREDEMTLFRENARGNELFFNKAPRKPTNPINILSSFTGIDDKRVLHWQIMQGRAPLSLWPEGHHILQTYAKEKEREGKKKGGQKRPAQSNQGVKQDPELKRKKNFEKHQKGKFNRKMRRESEFRGDGAGPSS